MNITPRDSAGIYYAIFVGHGVSNHAADPSHEVHGIDGINLAQPKVKPNPQLCSGRSNFDDRVYEGLQFPLDNDPKGPRTQITDPQS